MLKVLRLVLLLIFVVAPAIYTFNTVERVRDAYEGECATKTTTAKQRSEWTAAVAAFQKQAENLLNWSIAIGGGIVAFITTKSLHRFKNLQLLYLLLAPALACVVGSVYSALVFQRLTCPLPAYQSFGGSPCCNIS